MADWDFIECGFNSGDETINFGTRNFADGDNLYEASTLATVKNVDEIQNDSPVIKSAIIMNQVFFTINKTLRIFEDMMCSNICFSVTVEEIIDTFCVTSDGQYILLCLRNGVIHCFKLGNQNKVILTRCIYEDEFFEKKLFVEAFVEYNSTHLSFLVVLHNGKVFRITTAALSTFDNEGNDSKDDSITNYQCDMIMDFNCYVTAAAFYSPHLLLSGKQLIAYNFFTEKCIIEENYDLKRIFPYNSHMFLGLNGDGNLIQICSNTLTTFWINETQFEDFTLIHNACYTETQILAVAKKDEQRKSDIQLLTYPDFAFIFSIKVSGCIHLITPESLHDECMYITELKGIELRFQVISETLPEKRLDRLLRKQQFEEALRLAKLFNLNEISVWKAKAQAIVDKLVCDTADIENLLSLLDNIDDDIFKLQSCNTVHWCCSSLEDVGKVLIYGCSINIQDEETHYEAMNLSAKICCLMCRFNIFLELRKYDSTRYNIQDWPDFSVSDLIEDVLNKLECHYIEECTIIYNRLDSATVENLNEEKIQVILDELNNIAEHEYMPFLQRFLPITLSHLPSSLSLFVKWVTKKVLNLEQNNYNEFPENSIQFTNKFVPLLKANTAEKIDLQQQCNLNESALNELVKLLQALKHLQTLKKDYRINVPLKEYMKGPKALIHILLNIVMSEADFEVFVQEFLCPFILDNQLKPNTILFEEVQGIVKYEEKYWIKAAPSILKFITSTDLQLEAILTLLEVAKVPWSDGIHAIAKSAFKYDRPLVNDIRKKIEYEKKHNVLNRKSYLLSSDPVITLDDLKFVINRIIYCEEPTMIDDVYQLCDNATERYEATMLLITHFITIGDFDKCLEIFDNNSEKEILDCCLQIVRHLKEFFSTKRKFNVEENHYNVIGSIFKRIKNCTKDTKQKYLDDDLQNLRSLYKINKYFDIQVELRDIENVASKIEILNQLVSTTITKLDNGIIDLNECIQNCEKISSTLNVDKDFVFLTLGKMAGKFEVILEAAKKMYFDECGSRNLCLIANRILKTMGSSKSHEVEQDFSVVLVNEQIQTDTSLFLEGLQLADKLVIKAILAADYSDTYNCVQLAGWIQSAFFLVRNKSSEVSGLSENFCGSWLALPSVATFDALKNVYQLFIKYISNNYDPCMEYLVYFNDVPRISEEQLLEEIKHLPASIHNLCSEGHTLTAYKVMVTLQNALQWINVNPNVNRALDNIIVKQCVAQLLPQVLSDRYIDTDLAFALLLSYDYKSSISVIQQSLNVHKRNLKKFKKIAELGMRLSDYHNIPKLRNYCVNITYRAKWWEKIKNCRIPYDVFFKQTAEQLIEKLIYKNYLTVTSIPEFCTDFHLQVQIYYVVYLKSTLMNWKSDFEINTEIDGKKTLVIKNDEEQLYSSCKEIVNNITNTDGVIQILQKLYSTVNFYHYEVFICILKMISELNPTIVSNKLLLLLFLKSYNRVNKPSQMEIEQWYTAFPDTHEIDPLSEWRLPFTTTLFSTNIWNIIRPEINMETYAKWFNAITIFKNNLNKDEICSYAIKEVVSSGILQTKNNSEWILHPQHEELFSEIDKCAQNISDIALASGAVYHVATNTPRGADQVNAIKLSYEYAKKYRTTDPNNENLQMAFTKVQMKYYSYSAMHILHFYHLADDKYLQMATHPCEDLIEALYMDERILKKSESVVVHCPDINKAVDELAALYKLDVRKKKCALLNHWLLDETHTDFNLDVGLDTPAVSTAKCGNDMSADNLTRAIYICSCDDPTWWRSYLLDAGLYQDTKKFNYQARALKCFSAITKIDDIEKLTGISHEEFRIYIDKLLLLNDLEYLGFLPDIESLDKYNKIELLRMLAQYINSAVTIKIMAKLCKTYNIYELKYWEIIITGMIKLKMLRELKEYVFFLTNVTVCHYKTFYISAWQNIVDFSFNILKEGTEEQVTQLYIDNTCMLQTCPVLQSLNLEFVIKKCMQFKKYEFAALFLQYMPNNKHVAYAQDIFENDKNIYKNLDDLSKYGLCGILYAKTLLCNLK